MIAIPLLVLSALCQAQEPLSLGKPIGGEIGNDSPKVHTATLDANYTSSPTVGLRVVLQIPKAGIYTVELTSYDFDAYLVVEELQGALLAENDDGPLSTHAQVVVNFEAGGEYVAKACALHGKRGRFELRLLDGSPKPLSKAQQLQAEVEDRRKRLPHIEKSIGKESAEYAEEQHNLGTQLFSLGDFENARVELQSALTIREKVLGPEHARTAATLNNLSLVLRAQGNYAEARALNERALQIAEKVLGPEHPGTASCINSLAVLLTYQGNYAEALPLYERVLAIREKVAGPSHPSLAIGLNNLAALHKARGDYAQARRLYEKALAIYEEHVGEKHQNTAATLSNFASLVQIEGDYQEALRLHERAASIYEEVLGPKHPNTAQCLNNLAVLLAKQGDFARAVPLYQRALGIYKEILGPEHASVATSMNNFAHLLQANGQLEEAQELFEKSLAIRKSVLGLKSPKTAMSLNNLAVLYQFQGKMEEALPLFEQAREIYMKVLGPNHPDTATSINNLAALFKQQGEFAKAESLSQQSLKVYELVFGPDHPTTATSLNNLADLMVSQGKFESANWSYHRALEGTLSHLGRQLPSMSESGRFQLLKVSGDPEKLISSLTQGRPKQLEQYYATYQQWKGKALRLQAASVMLTRAGNSPEVRKKKGAIQVLSKELSELVLLPLASQGENHSERIGQLRSQRLQAERDLNRELGLDEVLSVPSFEEVNEGLPANSVCIDFFVGKKVFAWVQKPDGEVRLIPLGDTGDMRKAQDKFLRGTAVRGGRALNASEAQVAKQYFKELWEPIRDAIGEADQIFICPDGFLCELPFGILQEPNGDYLLERHRFVYLSDPTRFAAVAKASSNHEGPIFVVGGVNYFEREEAIQVVPAGPLNRSRIHETWSSLPGTRDEVLALSDFHKYTLKWDSPITVSEGSAATEEHIRAELPGKRYVHIATHGYFEPDHLPSLLLDAEEKQAQVQINEQVQAVGLLPGLLSGLVFAGVNGTQDPARDDGYLCAEEIQHIDMSACDLVVLSACESALGSARAGEGLMSLRRAFSVAGADTVISSLWKVDDQATAQLMKDFYTNLWQKGMSRGDALHQAKLRQLRRNRLENDGDALPRTWGAFVLSGQWN